MNTARLEASLICGTCRNTGNKSGSGNPAIWGYTELDCRSGQAKPPSCASASERREETGSRREKRGEQREERRERRDERERNVYTCFKCVLAEFFFGGKCLAFGGIWHLAFGLICRVGTRTGLSNSATRSTRPTLSTDTPVYPVSRGGRIVRQYVSRYITRYPVWPRDSLDHPDYQRSVSQVVSQYTHELPLVATY